ncbi:MAG: HAD family hydrolase [Chloroflexota bacterium]|nr:HAD family hydrolase [Chloroflexota bacterium]
MLSELPPAIIFDMDDTIIADSEMSERCWEEVCATFAPRLGDAPGETLLETIREIRRGNLARREQLERGGSDLRGVRQNLLSSAFHVLGIADNALVQEMTDSYMNLKSILVQPYPGSKDTLRRLKQNGIRLAMITNGPVTEQQAKIDRADLGHFFESIVIEGEFGVGKPDSRVFRHTLEQLQVSPEQTWVVGDNLVNDVGGAQAVGIYGVWVDWRGTGLPGNSTVIPDRIINSVVELVN